MALQNVRSLLWRGEDLGFGNGNARELIIPTQVAAGARPALITQGFVGTFNVGGLLQGTVTLVLHGKNRVIVNRNARYWITLNCHAAASNNQSTGINLQIPVPPLQMVFLPQNVISVGGTATISMNSSWPIPQPLSGSPGVSVPTATSTNALTFDWVTEA